MPKISDYRSSFSAFIPLCLLWSFSLIACMLEDILLLPVSNQQQYVIFSKSEGVASSSPFQVINCWVFFCFSAFVPLPHPFLWQEELREGVKLSVFSSLSNAVSAL